jgi:hypothetical protein
MRRFRTTAALFALLATMPWSLTAAECHEMPKTAGETRAAGGHHTDHAGAAHDVGGEPDAPPAGDTGRECDAIMACGAGLRGVAVAAVHPVVSPRPEVAWRVGLSEPSSADRTQDPPPPRQDA